MTYLSKFLYFRVFTFAYLQFTFGGVDSQVLRIILLNAYTNCCTSTC
jgi:hypothetical protein